MKTAFAAAIVLLMPCAAGWAAGSMDISEELDAQYGYVGGATTRGAGLNAGSVDEHNADVKYVVSPQVNKNLLLRFGGEWERFTFGVPDRSAVPRALQQASAVLGFDYQVADQWLARLEVEPGLYSDFRDISWRDFDAPVVLAAVYLADADLQWVLGLRIDARSQYPVLPVAGVRWKFADEWTMNFMLPNPRLEYDMNERFKLYLGAGVEGGTFAVGENFGSDHGQPKLDGAIVDFLEVRVGAGCSWKITPRVTLEAEAGDMPYRDFDFFSHDIEYRSHNAPYGQITCHARF
jgi:opacity protein-like surface antigen